MPLSPEPANRQSSNPAKRQDEYPQDTDLSQEEGGSTSDDGSVHNSPGPSRKKRLSGLTRKTKTKAKKMFNMDGAEMDSGLSSDENEVIGGIDHNAAFHTSALVKKKRFRPGKTADKTMNNIKSLGKAAVHPVESIKSKVTRTTAGQLSKTERPFLSQKADQEYLEAHDNLKQVESTSSSKRNTSDDEQNTTIGGHRDKVREMEAHRESLRAAWTTSRHVRRVRVVPKRHVDFPPNDYFMGQDEGEGSQQYDWLKWLGYVRNRIWYQTNESNHSQTCIESYILHAGLQCPVHRRF